jgi:hypothetical protein
MIIPPALDLSGSRGLYFLRPRLVRVALRTAAERPARPLVRAAFRAALERAALLRREAARFAWRESAA